MNPEFSPSAACAEFTSALTYDQIPEDVVDFVKKDLLDWTGCAIGGCADQSSQPIKNFVRIVGGKSQSGVIGEEKQSVVHAAMCNAYFGHILEMDDVDKDSISHPATVVIPPALATAEFVNKSGKDVILAIVCGFETMLRVGAAITPAHYKVFHTTSTTGVFGASMAAGKLLSLTQRQLLWSLGNAGTLSAGLWQFLQDGGMSKFLHTASASGNGVLVSLLAQQGFSGATHILEGSQGFFEGYARQPVNVDLFKDFGKFWRTNKVSFKPYPCCRHTHSAIDAALDLKAKLRGRNIRKIKLFTYNTAVQVAGKRSPTNEREAKFSITYCVASSILRGTPSDKDFDTSKVTEKDVSNLERLIEVVVDEEINRWVPKNWPCRIEAEADDGEILVSQVWSPKGDPDNSLDWDAVISKFKIMTDGVITTVSQDEVIEFCQNFDSVTAPGVLFEKINKTFQTKY